MGNTMTIERGLQVSIAIVEAFSADCWSEICLGHVTCKLGVADDPIFKFPDPELLIHYTTFMGRRLKVVYR